MGNKNQNPNADNVKSSQTGSDDEVTVNVGSGNVAVGVCIKSGSKTYFGNSVEHSGVISSDGDYGSRPDKEVEPCYSVSGIGTSTVKVTRLNDKCQGISHIDVLFESASADYCDPANRPRGQSIGQWVPKDVNCVVPSVNAVCGALEGSVTNLTPLNYGISWSEGSPDYNFNTSLPASFPEDYNGGNVTVYYWVVGAEADYVTGRNIPNYWEQNAASVTIDTDCEENGGQGGGTTPTTPVTPSGTTTAVSKPVIQQPAQVSAPQAGVNAGEGGGAGSVIAPVTALMGSLGSLAYGVIRLRRFGA
ncbi:MAG TPA: hypothetical protein VFK11_04185 [Candidatus Saccharimonadales bacterium]|nr:hypothetical protein [Candidatus Saccharimonadales bacterium]